jgi:hypothetical protein
VGKNSCSNDFSFRSILPVRGLSGLLLLRFPVAEHNILNLIAADEFSCPMESGWKENAIATAGAAYVLGSFPQLAGLKEFSVKVFNVNAGLVF